MIVDVHSHTWLWPDHMSGDFVAGLGVSRADHHVEPKVDFDAFMAAMAPCDRVICFGLRGKLTGLAVPNEHVAAFVARAPEKLIGFLSVDPNEQGWLDEAERCHKQLNLRGVKLGPIYGGFDPNDPRLEALYGLCVKLDMPVMMHVGTSFVQSGPLEYGRPIHADALARRWPELRLVLAHLGHPWEGETIAVIRKHPHVYADVSALHYRPWQLYHSLMLAQEYGVMHKILFGSDYPFTTPEASMAGLRNINRFCGGTSLPRVSEQAMEELIHRDALALLWKDPPR